MWSLSTLIIISFHIENNKCVKFSSRSTYNSTKKLKLKIAGIKFIQLKFIVSLKSHCFAFTTPTCRCSSCLRGRFNKKCSTQIVFRITNRDVRDTNLTISATIFNVILKLNAESAKFFFILPATTSWKRWKESELHGRTMSLTVDMVFISIFLFFSFSTLSAFPQFQLFYLQRDATKNFLKFSIAWEWNERVFHGFAQIRLSFSLSSRIWW